jgi:DNA-binding NarL/FixJ family response regulator
MSISVCLVEDNEVIRESLSYLIQSSEGLTFLGSFSGSKDALKEIPKLQPKVVLFDIEMPGLDGIACIEQLKPDCPNTQFMLLTVFEDDDKIFRSIQAGATGYLLKKTPSEKIIESIHEIKNGGSPMNTQIARKVVQFLSSVNIQKNTNVLSSREYEILEMVAKGYRFKEIAKQLFLSVETIRTHIRNIYEKLQVNSKIEAINKVFYQSNKI